MNSKIIPQGNEAKFKVEIKDFDMVANEFYVELVYGYYRTNVTIQKSQMVTDESDNYYFYLDTDCIVGEVIARCVWLVPDTDAENDLRTMVDEQVLCFVAATPNPQLYDEAFGSANGAVKYTYILPETPAEPQDQDGGK